MTNNSVGDLVTKFARLLSPFGVILALCAAYPAAAVPTASRTWVSAEPARIPARVRYHTVQRRSYARFSVTAVGGEIDVLSPGGYGGLTINHAISIIDDGSGEAGIQILRHKWHYDRGGRHRHRLSPRPDLERSKREPQWSPDHRCWSSYHAELRNSGIW